jgi:hypothetical protein
LRLVCVLNIAIEGTKVQDSHLTRSAGPVVTPTRPLFEVLGTWKGHKATQHRSNKPLEEEKGYPIAGENFGSVVDAGGKLARRHNYINESASGNDVISLELRYKIA